MTIDPMNPEIIASVQSEVEAASIVAALAAHGIEAHSTGGVTAGLRALAPSHVDVLVRKKDLQQATEALKDIRGDFK